MTAPITLDNCEREPIHIPGAIQPHGVLFACRGADLAIHQVSANAADYVERTPAQLLGTPVTALFDAETGERLRAAAAAVGSLRELNPIAARTTAGRELDAVVHRPAPDVLVIELEPLDDERMPGYDPRLRAAIVRLQASRSAQELCEIAAEQVRVITGFDRVMIYRFDAAWNGEVVAEARRDDLEPFLGLHYPASDIPAQARRLYTINWLRFIADIGYAPSPIEPTLDPHTAAPLDLSHSTLRSVSPIHIEYLRNMGVSASMSVSLVIDGELAGLIACHHYSGPRLVAYRARDTAEYLGQALSWQLRVLELADGAERARAASLTEGQIVRAAATSPDLVEGLATGALLELTGARGAAVVLQEGIRRVGDCPNHRELAELVDWLALRPEDVFVTDHAGGLVPGLDGDRFAGVLAVAVSRDLREYLLWFRPPTERTVDWAGDPRKLLTSPPGAPPRLSPRGSFALWRETVRGQALPWEPWRIEAASNLRKALLGGVRLRAAELRDINQRLLDADRAKDDFISTVSHELRTPLNAVVGWTELLQSGVLPPERVQHGIDVIQRNARAQVELVDDLLDVSRMVSGKLDLDVESVDYVALVTSVLDSFEIAAGSKQLRIKRVLDPSATPVVGDATRLRQVIANLLNNAVKFTPKSGSITVVLRRAESDIELLVRDSGEGIAPELLPLVFDLFRQGDGGMNRRSRGLGIGLAIAKKLVELHGGRLSADSDGKGHGATFTLRIPISPVRQTPTTPSHVPRMPSRQLLAGVSVLVVEDEPDARELVGQLLTLAGATVASAGDAATALRELTERTFDAIVSDVGMPGRDGFELMGDVRRRGIETPAVALTAYSRAHDRTAALHAGFSAHVPKPVDAGELVTVVASLTGRIPRSG